MESERWLRGLDGGGLLTTMADDKRLTLQVPKELGPPKRDWLGPGWTRPIPPDFWGSRSVLLLGAN